MRIGHGYDAHRYKAGRRLVLCGTEIPFEMGLDGHSDADAPVHALMDAMLGAAALGSIGDVFPDNDDQWLDADSIEMLKTVNTMVKNAGYAFGNCDITIIAQKPKLAPFIGDMRKAVSDALDTDISHVSVKATTEEKMGFTGTMEGLAAHAVVLIY